MITVDWKEDAEKISNIGCLIEALLDSGGADVEWLSKECGLDMEETERIILSFGPWFDYSETEKGLRIDMTDPQDGESPCNSYLQGVLERINESYVVFEEHGFDGRVWIQPFYQSQDVIRDNKSSGTYYRMRLPGRMLSMMDIEKEDKVRISQEVDENGNQFLRGDPVESTENGRYIYKIFDEAPSNTDPKITLPAEFKQDFIHQGTENLFKIEVWETDQAYLRIYSKRSYPTPRERKTHLSDSGYWANLVNPPLPEFFFTNLLFN